MYIIAVLASMSVHAANADVRRTYARTFTVTSSAMAPTLDEGDYVTAVRSHRVKRNSVAVFTWWGDDQDMVMRVVALDGDTVQMRSGYLRINGIQQHGTPLMYQEPDAGHPWIEWQREFTLAEGSDSVPTRDNWGPIVVPAGHAFVLGDNRHGSLDSRYRGFVSLEDVRYTIRSVYFSKRGLRRLGAPVL